MPKLVLATKNKGKIEEIRELLKDIEGLEVISLLDLPEDIVPDIKETGKTFEENAYIKAYEVAKATGLPALADDSGLEVDALGGKPGVRSARFGGENISDSERNQKLLALLENVPEPHRTARFKCCMVLVVPPEFDKYVVEETCEGVITRKERGKHGFGYDPIFYLPKLGRTMAELTREEKNRISHRGKALLRMKEIIRSVLSE
ncbi:dITP/XTP pyrophosphatase [Thermosulfidibacter takaii ABI70S6]|uniref:dITP/XTP pyrophosphatase n=1 Tax=Thermosulfidibacter takaii (strain DSM 17441 / JCM 13301 / NBRC 103674 / ABI70S6) TaxID=1298851 RepID=A0A0S3QT73_THET7|nr:XTP/dITP diphosphatase [Thermosulfidibacter takaii]BAT71523.1 dITP/XTP pyrophosphatase [Thermosulfidibacter takaii ABI70S6]